MFSLVVRYKVSSVSVGAAICWTLIASQDSGLGDATYALLVLRLSMTDSNRHHDYLTYDSYNSRSPLAEKHTTYAPIACCYASPERGRRIVLKNYPHMANPLMLNLHWGVGFI